MAWSSNGRPSPQALWIEHGPGADGVPGLSQVRHPGFEWQAEIDASSDLDSKLRQAANAYVAALAEQVEELAGLNATLADRDADFGWLPVTWGLGTALPADLNPNKSYLLTRGDADDWQEASLVLLAARRLRLGEHAKAIGDAVGLRVTAHVRRDPKSATWRLRITSLNASRLAQASEPLHAKLRKACSQEVHAALEQALSVGGRPLKYPAVNAMRDTAVPDQFELQGVAVRRRDRLPGDPKNFKPRARVYAFSATMDVEQRSVQSVNVSEVLSRGAAPALFDRDPASLAGPAGLARSRPSRADALLDAFRESPLPASTPVKGATQGPEGGNGLFVVTHERTAVLRQKQPASAQGAWRQAQAPNRAEADPVAKLPARSDDLAAAQADLRARQLFDRLQAYGFNLKHYFRHVRLPLELRARARLRGAFDGRAVNAEVRPFFGNSNPGVDLLEADVTAPYSDGQRPQLLVRLGSADTKVHAGPQTLGLAADPRWAWHEFGHVLNYAATGELEFAFAHSAGDALAAITADTDSLLSVDATLRGNTFPWAYVPRRHDRQAVQGYCWCGARNVARHARPLFAHYRHGYLEEQLLSSSLFRLYRSLGGDTGALGTPEPATQQQRDDLAVRRSASDYCVYLVMRAIALLGPNGVVPARSVDQFVGALIDADLGTGDWTIQARWPDRVGEGEGKVVKRSVQRHGGRVHKVIRWAFEQQGLYATPQADETVEGPGLAPTIDVYIADRRQSVDPSSEAGGYAPVPLRWHDQGREAWYADERAIRRDGSGRLQVEVRQRGVERADRVELRVWVALADRALQWQQVQAEWVEGTPHFTATIPGTHRSRPLWVLACTQALADPSTLPPGEEPPTDQNGLIELVANDNNLGLAYIR